MSNQHDQLKMRAQRLWAEPDEGSESDESKAEVAELLAKTAALRDESKHLQSSGKTWAPGEHYAAIEQLMAETVRLHVEQGEKSFKRRRDRRRAQQGLPINIEPNMQKSPKAAPTEERKAKDNDIEVKKGETNLDIAESKIINAESKANKIATKVNKAESGPNKDDA